MLSAYVFVNVRVCGMLNFRVSRYFSVRMSKTIEILFFYMLSLNIPFFISTRNICEWVYVCMCMCGCLNVCACVCARVCLCVWYDWIYPHWFTYGRVCRSHNSKWRFKINLVWFWLILKHKYVGSSVKRTIFTSFPLMNGQHALINLVLSVKINDCNQMRRHYISKLFQICKLLYVGVRFILWKWPRNSKSME